MKHHNCTDVQTCPNTNSAVQTMALATPRIAAASGSRILGPIATRLEQLSVAPHAMGSKSNSIPSARVALSMAPAMACLRRATPLRPCRSSPDRMQQAEKRRQISGREASELLRPRDPEAPCSRCSMKCLTESAERMQAGVRGLSTFRARVVSDTPGWAQSWERGWFNV